MSLEKALNHVGHGGHGEKTEGESAGQFACVHVLGLGSGRDSTGGFSVVGQRYSV